MSDQTLPILSGPKICKILSKADFVHAGQKGDHVKLKKDLNGKKKTVIVPNHPKVAKGTLNSILKQAGINRDEFFKLLEEI